MTGIFQGPHGVVCTLHGAGRTGSAAYAEKLRQARTSYANKLRAAREAAAGTIYPSDGIESYALELSPFGTGI